MLVADRSRLHGRRHQNVGTHRLGQCEGLGVDTVEGAESHRRRPGVDPRICEQFRQQDSGPFHTRHPPPRDALHVLGDGGLRQTLQVGEGQRQGPLDESVYPQLVVRAGLVRDPSGYRIEAEPAAPGNQPRQPGRVVGGDRVQARGDAASDHYSQPCECDHPDDDTTTYGRTAVGRGTGGFGRSRHATTLGVDAASHPSAPSSVRTPS